jgi:glycosyltransferase involved in cell wall biosynthesis
MRIAFITRSTLYSVPGGDTEQVLQTARFLKELGVEVDIYLAKEKINYTRYDLLHAFNITRPADILYHMRHTRIPLVVSTILVNYTEFDMHGRRGLPGFVIRLFPPGANEYVKAIGRWALRKDSLRSKSYLWKGQENSIREILQRAAMLLPNSEGEYRKIEQEYRIKKNYAVIPNGIDPAIFGSESAQGKKEERWVLSAARIEGRKNQLNLIRAMNDTPYTLLLTGLAAPNQKKYYEECRRIASQNIIFCGRVPLDTLVELYRCAKVHVLPSWHETCGLSSLEAAAMGCNIVITDKGFTREYFGEEAFYCDPGDPGSIFAAVEKAAQQKCNEGLRQKVLREYSWPQAAATTLEAYKNIIPICGN